MKKAYLLVVMVIFIGKSHAGIPVSQKITLLPLQEKAVLQLTVLNKNSAQQLPLKSKTGKVILRPHKIAETFKIGKSIDEFGQWQLVNGIAVWRLQIKGKDALHLNLGLANFHLPESAQIFITDSITGEILKQYSATDNKPHGQLWTPLFNTNQLQIEINLPTTEKEQLKLKFVQAGKGTHLLNDEEDNTKSGSCNVNVCPAGVGWEDTIRSVVKYTISDGNGTYACTGTLVNNSRGDMTPLVLTAAHCLVSDITAPSMVFYWNYQQSVETCNGIPDGDLSQTQTGARLISRWDDLNSGSDFALVKLDEKPAVDYQVYYSGWDNRKQNFTGTRTIHHPVGTVNVGNSEKRISIDIDPLTITAYDDEVIDPGATYFRVGQWEQGTTEGGSSGAGLWNSNQYLIGTLSGGNASCADLSGSDWFGRMASHWMGNGFHSNQLASYLTPDNNPVSVIGGIDSCDSATVTIGVSNVTPLAREQISFTSSVSGGLPGYDYEWDFNSDGIIDSTDANPAYTYNSSANYRITLIVRDSTQCPAVVQTGALVADPREKFLANGEIPDGFIKTENAEGSWLVDDIDVSEGLFSLKTQIINGDSISGIEISGDYESGTLSFDRRVSSETDLDNFKFFIDDVEQFSISGEQDWQKMSYKISAGNHTFRWSFEKDEALSGGQDAAWIDNFVYAVDLPPTPSVPPPRKRSGGSMEYLLFGILLLLSRYKGFRQS